MFKHIVISDVLCPKCNTQMYTERQEDDNHTLTLKCTDEACVNFNKPYVAPTVELKLYVKPPVKK
jgi:hypothetical protein